MQELPVASFALIWRVLFDAHGLINSILVWFGIESVPFMNSGASFWVLVGSYIWKNLGFDMVLILSALLNIPQSLYEAAQLDGANGPRQFRYITLPHLYPTLFVTAVLSINEQLRFAVCGSAYTWVLFSTVNATVLHNLRLTESTDAEPGIQRNQR